MSDLVENFCLQSRGKILKDILVHLDTARPHNPRRSCEYIEGFRAHRVPNPAYSLDLATSNCFLFGYLKTKLAGLGVQSREKRILTIRQIFNDIPKEMLIFVYVSWKKVDVGDQEQERVFSLVTKK
jgi:hypothetical protein